MQLRNKYGTLKVIDASNGRMIKCKCERCGAVGEYDKYWLDEKRKEGGIDDGSYLICRQCRRFQGIELGKVNSRGFRVMGYGSGKNGELTVNAIHTACNHNVFMSKEEFKQGTVRCTVCNPNGQKAVRKIEKPEVKSNGSSLIAGAYSMEDDNRLLKDKAIQKNKEELVDKIRDKGMLKVDLKGKIYNGLRVIKYYNYAKSYRCNVECIRCGTKQTCDLIDLIRGKVMCDNKECIERVEPLWCPNCKKVKVQTREGWLGKGSDRGALQVKISDIYSGKKLVCPVCGKPVYLSDEAYKKDLESTLEETLDAMDREKYGDYGNIDYLSNLAVCHQVAYTGRDGKPRFNCFCVEHRKHLCLSLDDVRAYNHEYCDCDNMLSIEKVVKKKSKKKDDDEPAYYK